jgi:hypothetical protein
MSEKLLNLIYYKYGIKRPENSFDSTSIGHVRLDADMDIVEHVATLYFNHVMHLLSYHEKATEGIYDRELDQAKKLIKQQLFPRYQDYRGVFNKFYDFPDHFNELSFLPQHDGAREYFTLNHDNSPEGYYQFLKAHAPKPLSAKFKQSIDLEIESSSLLHHHTMHIAQSRFGKSEFIKVMIYEHLRQTKTKGSIILLDPNGDMAEEVTAYQQFSNSDRLVYLNPFLNEEHSFTLNLFDIDISGLSNLTIDSITQSIMDTFTVIIGEQVITENMRALLMPVINTVLRIPNANFYTVQRFMNDNDNKDLLEFAINYGDPIFRPFFEYSFKESDTNRSKRAIYTKLQLLLNNRIFVNMTSGSSTIDFEDLMNDPNKVIVVALNLGKMKDSIKAFGALFTSAINSIAFKREALDKEDRTPTTLIIDEAPMFINSTTDIILSQAGKYKLFQHLAFQYLDQMNPQLKQSVLSNTRIKVVGVNSTTSHQIMSKELDLHIDQLKALNRPGEFYIRFDKSPALRFQGSAKLITQEGHYMSSKEYEVVIKEQLQKYYRKVDDSAELEREDLSAFIDTGESESSTHYSKQKSEELEQILDF